ncbi:hypothetical protein PVAP13_2NG263300 [Panicum virgatum]|uniref:Uncharacterized protein n=1 Tax=Panicum virgatum TaxID=38727 RepID=A0A8T0VPH0_PANVG|nr:hypothetical protein PVAP13_2NG263300 [Panicum virgatum]
MRSPRDSGAPRRRLPIATPACPATDARRLLPATATPPTPAPRDAATATGPHSSTPAPYRGTATPPPPHPDAGSPSRHRHPVCHAAAPLDAVDLDCEDRSRRRRRGSGSRRALRGGAREGKSHARSRRHAPPAVDSPCATRAAAVPVAVGARSSQAHLLHTVVDLAPPASTPRGPLPSRRWLKSSPHLLDSSTPPSVSRFSDVLPSL